MLYVFSYTNLYMSTGCPSLFLVVAATYEFALALGYNVNSATVSFQFSGALEEN